MTPLPIRARAFGIDWATDIAVPQFDDAPSAVDPAAIVVSQVERLAERIPAATVGRGHTFADGFRFGWMNTATFDVRGGERIDYLPGPGWHGVMPAAFYSTVAALTLAGRGLLPIHASAIELDGRAFLLAGPAGAGKSTLAAELLTAGARLISDDLTIVRPATADEPFAVVRGRPAMRLHPSTAAMVEGGDHETVPDDPRGKILIRPDLRVEDHTFPLTGLLLLAGEPEVVSPAAAVQLWPQLLFRPRWCRALPGHGGRKARLLELASRVPVIRMPPVNAFDPKARLQRVDRVLAVLSASSSRRES